jgi:3-oxoacyl-[acyl-carrier protein] reductase
VTVNLVGAMHGCRAALPGMLAAGGGTIVNISSGAAERPLEGWSAYCAAKAGLAMLTRSLGLECGGRGVNAYGLRPGVVDTAMQVTIRASGVNEVSRIPRESLGGTGDPARAVAYLCTPAAADLAGGEVDIYDAAFRARAGLEAR